MDDGWVYNARSALVMFYTVTAHVVYCADFRKHDEQYGLWMTVGYIMRVAH